MFRERFHFRYVITSFKTFKNMNKVHEVSRR